MPYEVLKSLFYELFDVSHLMDSLVDEVESTYDGGETMRSFFEENIKSECTKKSVLKHIEDYSASCLGAFSDEDVDAFLNELFD